MKVMSYIIAINVFISVIEGQTFGYGSKYTCHCDGGDCDDKTGVCSSRRCERGWIGKNCQNENVARGKTVYQSSTYKNSKAENAVDGDISESSFSHTGKVVNGQNYWQVDLGQVYPITNIVIYRRLGSHAQRLKGFYIDTGDTYPPSTQCQREQNGPLPASTLRYALNCTGRYLRITNTIKYNKYAHVNLCEVEIYVCAPGTFGSNCESLCYCKRHKERCDKITGECPSGCSDGFGGRGCDISCFSVSSYGPNCQYRCNSRKCQQQQSSCDVITGTCDGECQIRWKSPDCQVCNNGLYGFNCNKQCSDRNCKDISATCGTNGDCGSLGCARGYRGVDCTNLCDNGRYGIKCGQYCNSRQCKDAAASCLPFYGYCGDAGCKDGYIGIDCTQDCDSGFYGAKCAHRCSERNCFHSYATCNNIDGRCDPSGCKQGYKGTDCTQECEEGRYGDRCSKTCSNRKCLNSVSSCDHVTGKCDNECKAGYRDEDCTKECRNGVYYGLKCSKRCSDRKCSSLYSSCDHETGSCNRGLCKDNYVGVDCAQKCPDGVYGKGCKKKCSDRKCTDSNDKCTDGTCQSPCLPGYLSFDCFDKCFDGSYGTNCSLKCENRQCNVTDNNICDHIKGSCQLCVAGFGGVDCTQPCSSDRYGVNCTGICDNRNCKNKNPCDTKTGTCKGGCIDGFESHDCTLKIVQPPEYGSAAIIGAVVGLIVLIAIIVIVVFIVFRRRKRATKSRESDNNEYAQADEKSRSKPYNRVPKNEYLNVSFDTDLTKDASDTTAVKTNTGQTKPVIAPKPSSSKNNESNEYYNLTDMSNTMNGMPVTDLKAFVQNSSKDFFSNTHQNLPSGFTAVYHESQITANKPKNRFLGYYPYDFNRVVLSIQNEDQHSDYINASYVDTYGKPRYFIAAQGPTKVTNLDFIRMIFEQKCEKIIMLTNLLESGKHKCERYWPEKDKEVFGNMELSLIEERQRSTYTTRKMKVKNTKTGEKHETTQFHFTAWLDHDVPKVNDLLAYLYRVENHYQKSNSPVLIHCSAGIGRTGSYIAIDSLIKEGRANDRIDILSCIKKIRTQRKNLIQTPEQLQFVYKALVTAFELGQTYVPIDVYEAKLKQSKSFSLSKLSRSDEFKMIKKMENKADQNKIYVSNEHLTIHRAPSWLKSKGYLLADMNGQDFESIWKLITNHDSKIVVVMTSAKNTIILCPVPGEQLVSDTFTIYTQRESKLSDNIRLSTVTVSRGEFEIDCRVLFVNCDDEKKLSSLKPLVKDLMSELEEDDTGTFPLTILYSSKLQAAIVCIIRNVIQMMKVDNEVEIFNTTSRIMESLYGAITSMAEYNFLYEVVADYIGNQNVYENL